MQELMAVRDIMISKGTADGDPAEGQQHQVDLTALEKRAGDLTLVTAPSQPGERTGASTGIADATAISNEDDEDEDEDGELDDDALILAETGSLIEIGALAEAGAEQLPPELAWQERALCAQTDPEAFFPEKGGSTREAKRVCMSCEVRAECLDYALAKDERFGIWGGLSERERRRVKKQAV